MIMNPGRRCGNVTLFLAIAVSVFCACYCVLTTANRYYSACYKLDAHQENLQGWEACRKTNPAFYEANTKAVSCCLKDLDEAEGSLWVNLPLGQLIGLHVLGCLVGAGVGYGGTWLVLQTGRLAVYKLIRWIGLRFHGEGPGDGGRQQQSETTQAN